MLGVIAPLRPLISLNETILHFFHDNVGFGWGLSIIALTLTVRLAILPLTYRQVRGMQQMQRLAPEMKKLQERYKDDKQRQQQELMKFYSEHNFNPLSSCLPLLLQLPFFLSLYYLQRQGTFKTEVRETGKSFLFIPDLTSKATGVVLVVLIVIYVGTQLGSSLVTMINAQDKNQRRLMLALPFVFTFVVISFPAGLLLYWITTNLWTIGQQLAVRKFLPPPEPLAATAGGAGGASASSGGGDEKPKGRWQSMLDRAAQGSGGGGSKDDGKAAPGGSKPRSGSSSKGSAKSPPKSPSGKAKGSGDGKGPSAGNGGPAKPPPRSPRKKKKRSGRRR
ncbi:MAG: YidC/Oxa1 family rane protein insertase [Thermoleophilaceae bacterium]|jgi:YidC/Oxa1 family membrane protein insertase|nr:YidC/Oxa1 family rane protein insertase [Thermoleophilaceae bacterium]